MNQYEFNKLLEKYLDGQCSEQEEQLIHEWYQQTVDTTKVDLPTDEKEQLKQTIWKRIKGRTLDIEINPKHRIWRYLAIAASFLLILSIGLTLFNKNKSQTDDTFVIADKALKEIKNTTPKEQDIRLEDGTTVSLHPLSILSYPEHFTAQNRTVYLTGEALFKVKRNPKKPFLVHTGNLVTEVLGTSFIVKSNIDSKLTEVRVLSGKVSVYEETHQNEKNRKGTILTPNHKVTYNTESKQLTPSIVEEPIVVTETKTAEKIAVVDYTFDDTRLPKVLDVIKKRYALNFIIGNENLNNCVFTGDLNGDPLFKQLDFICKSMNAHYEIRGTDIFITGEGCQ